MTEPHAEPPPAEEDPNLARPPEPMPEPLPAAGASDGNPVSSAVRRLGRVVVFILLAMMLWGWWSAILAWYVTMWLWFGLFFLMFRLFRRERRQEEKEKLQHHELVQAIQHGDVSPEDLGSERVVIPSPMSFTGAYRRTKKIWMDLFPES